MHTHFLRYSELEVKAGYHADNNYTFSFPGLKEGPLKGVYAGVTTGKVGCYSIDEKWVAIYYTELSSKFGTIKVGIPKEWIGSAGFLFNPANAVSFMVIKVDEIYRIYLCYQEDIFLTTTEGGPYLKILGYNLDPGKRILGCYDTCFEPEKEKLINDLEESKTAQSKKTNNIQTKQYNLIAEVPKINTDIPIKAEETSVINKYKKTEEKEAIGFGNLVLVVIRFIAFIGFGVLCFVFAAELDVARVIIFWLPFLFVIGIIVFKILKEMWHNWRK